MLERGLEMEGVREGKKRESGGGGFWHRLAAAARKRAKQFIFRETGKKGGQPSIESVELMQRARSVHWSQGKRGGFQLSRSLTSEGRVSQVQSRGRVFLFWENLTRVRKRMGPVGKEVWEHGGRRPDGQGIRRAFRFGALWHVLCVVRRNTRAYERLPFQKMKYIHIWKLSLLVFLCVARAMVACRSGGFAYGEL